jgi:hypothetical protein
LTLIRFMAASTHLVEQVAADGDGQIASLAMWSTQSVA